MAKWIFSTLRGKGNRRRVPAKAKTISFELSCSVKGDSSVFDVEVTSETKVSALKKLVHQEKDKGILRDVNASDLVLWKPSIQIHRIPEATCLDRVDALDFSQEAIRLDGGYEVASIFPQFVPLETLEALRNRDKRPITIAPEHDPETLGNKTLGEEHLHIIVQKPDIANLSTKKPYTVVVLPIDGDQFRDHLLLEVYPWNPIATIHDRIRHELQAIRCLGEFFRSDLEIRPLPLTPTLLELREQNPAQHRNDTYWRPKDLPGTTFDKFFNWFYVEEQQNPHVHFLVWLPPGDQRSPADPISAISWFISSSLMTTLNFENATTASQNRENVQLNFKALLKREYHQPDDGKLFDMATGTRLPYSVVVASHIFQHKWQSEMSRFTSLTDINDVRNGLLLYKPVEWAFDRAKLCVEVKPPTNEMSFRLLDRDLYHIVLADKACDLRNEAKHGNKRLVEEENLQMTFGDLDGKPLTFPEGAVMRPSKRLLGLHALLSLWTAQDRAPQTTLQMVSYDASGDEEAQRAIKNSDIFAWRDNVDANLDSDFE